MSSKAFLDETKALACVHCGLCLGSCPTYLETGNENDSPRGRVYLMRAVESGRLELEASVVRHIDLCLGCRACETACPSGVQYGALLEETREHIERSYQRPPRERWLREWFIEGLFPYPGRMRLALAPGRWLRKLGMHRIAPEPLRSWLALLDGDQGEARLPERIPSAGLAVRKVALIRGCVMSVMFGRANAATAELVAQAGGAIWIPPGQGCCGALFSHSGNLDAARECARRNIAVFEAEEVDDIVINAAGCGSALKDYGQLLEDDREWRERARQFSGRVKDLTEWLLRFDTRERRWTGGRVTYHDACHLAHAQRIQRAPRELIQRAAGPAYVELSEADVCCGSAGSYNLTEPEMAGRLQRRKTENIARTGADCVVTTNPGCMLQIASGLRARGRHGVQVLHIAEFLHACTDQAGG